MLRHHGFQCHGAITQTASPTRLSEVLHISQVKLSQLGAAGTLVRAKLTSAFFTGSSKGIMVIAGCSCLWLEILNAGDNLGGSGKSSALVTIINAVQNPTASSDDAFKSESMAEFLIAIH